MITFNPKDRIIFQKLFKHKLFRDEIIYSNEEERDPNHGRVPSLSLNKIFILVISDQIHLAQKFIEDYIDDLEPLGNKSMMPMK